MKRLISAIFIACNLGGCQLTETIANETTLFDNPKYPEYIQSGDIFPLKTIVDLNGNMIDLTNNEKRKLVILFATWCSDSNRALKALNQSPLLHDKNIEVVAIAREENRETVTKWRDENNINVPLAVDPDRKIYAKFAKGGIPRLVTVSKDNKLIKMNLAEGERQLDKIIWLQ